jgi:hypothetical protein
MAIPAYAVIGIIIRRRKTHYFRQIRAYQDLPGGPGGPFKWLAEGRRLARPSWRSCRGLALGTGSGAREVLLGQPAGSALGSKSVCAGVVVRRSALLSVGVFAGHAAFVLVSGSACPSWHARGQRFEPA